MKRAVCIVALLVIVSARAQSSAIAIRGATVVDVSEGVLHPAHTVLVTGNRIASVGPVSEAALPPGIEIVEADGRYLIPGLWDMRTHSVANVTVDRARESSAAQDWHFPLFLAHGVTGIRNMNDGTGDVTLELTRSVRRRMAEGALVGPSRFLTAGPSLDGDPPLGGNPDLDRLLSDSAPHVVPNDNRHPAGSLRDGVIELDLEAMPASWQPEGEGGPDVPAFAFAESGGSPRIPGPILRLAQGAEVRITVRNSIPPGRWIGLPPENRRNPWASSVTSDALFVHGLTAGTGADETLVVPYGESREVHFRAEQPGTFLYWAATQDLSLWAHTGTDAQLVGAIVVDPAGSIPDPEERLFVITMTDAFPDPSLADPGEDQFQPAINGLSWPHTERLRYALGDTVRWRWINGSHFQHPMHLHGFHYRTLARGDGVRETRLPPGKVQEVVTELMEPGSTFRMEWTATRPGNWLMHCHIVNHVVPSPERDVAGQMHDLHDVTRHPLEAMEGLVMGITVIDDGPEEADGRSEQHLRLLAREKPAEARDGTIRGFVLAGDQDPPEQEFLVPGPPIILTRGETTRITVVNQMREHTTVHWHGLELQSVYDGVAGWSRTGSRVAPLIAPGDSFDVYIRPPRAGTFIYHSHMDEMRQVMQGLYGPLLVLEPGERFDPERDRIFVIADAIDGDYHSTTINGRRYPAPLTLHAGTEYRFRFINISDGTTADIRLSDGSEILTWRAYAKDGAVLPPAMQRDVTAVFRTQAGETYDFLWRPANPVDAKIVVEDNFGLFGTLPGRLVLHQPIRVIAPPAVRD